MDRIIFIISKFLCLLKIIFYGLALRKKCSDILKRWMDDVSQSSGNYCYKGMLGLLSI